MSQKLLIDADLVGNAQGSDTKAETALAAMFSETAVVGKAPVAKDDGEGNPVFDDTWKMRNDVVQGINTNPAQASTEKVPSEKAVSTGLAGKANSNLSNLTSDALSNAKIMPIFTGKTDGSIGSTVGIEVSGTSANPASFTLPNYGTWLCSYLTRGTTYYYFVSVIVAGGTVFTNDFYYATLHGSAFRIA